MFENSSKGRPIQEKLSQKDDEVFAEAVRPGSPQEAWEKYRKRVAERSKKKKKFGEGNFTPQVVGGSPRDY
jgi:hypothetical protein